MNIRIAFYKGRGRRRDRLIRWWTKSPYSHVEIVIPNRGWWLGIHPPESPNVRKKINYGYKESEWDFLDFAVTNDQIDSIIRFYNLTKGDAYDWVGMIVSHVTPFKVKHIKKWYCSEWVIYALEYAGVIRDRLCVKNKMPPEEVYNILQEHISAFAENVNLKDCIIH
tara:strand:- start:2295 stop:2795 length:501 start_codon:yes stop_codon:yes gene_type:complete